MRLLIFLLLCFCIAVNAQAQERRFTYLGEIESESRIKIIADSLKLPLLITGKKVYAFDCVGRLLGGDVNDRDEDGDSGDRLNDGDANKRNSGGGINDRKTKSGKNNRNKKGKNNNRNKDGDNNDRDEDGDTNNRNADGSIAEGTRCSVSKKGKTLLYTREKIDSKNAKVFYLGKYFTNKHFKIIQL